MDTPVSSLHVAALAGLERAVNAALSMDARARAGIAALAGKVIAIRCTVPALAVFVLPRADGVSLLGWYEQGADCEVSGQGSDFIAVLGAADKAGALVNGNLRIRGDSAPLLALEKILSTLDIDWEERLSLLVGDAPAHGIGRALRGTLRLGARAHEALLRHVEEFVHEEARLAPPRLEVEDFLADLQLLSTGAERADAAVRRLDRRLKALDARRRERRAGGG